MARWIGIDYGTRRIGLAIGELSDNICIAAPHGAIQASKSQKTDAQAVAEFAREQGAHGLVVGVPFNMDDSVGPQAKITQNFVAQLRSATTLPIELQDERLSSYAADELARDTGGVRSRKSGQRDALAATVILQEFLNARRAAAHPEKPAPNGDAGPACNAANSQRAGPAASDSPLEPE